MIPRVVEVACRELSQLGNALVVYQALGAIRDYLEVFKALLYYPAAHAKEPEDALRIMSGPVELSVETLGLEERHGRVVFQLMRKVALLGLLKPETQRRPRTPAEPSSGASRRSLENWRNPFPLALLLSA